MKKVLFIASVVKTHIMQFHIPYLKMFKDAGWEVYVAARNDYQNPEDCRISFCDYYYNISFNRNPFAKENFKAFKELREIAGSEHFDIVHCHTPIGGVLGRLAFKSARKTGTKVIYTAHGFHFFKGCPIKNWVYYPVEKLCSRYTDILITMNKEDYSIAEKCFKAKRNEFIPGIGVDINKFANAASKRDELALEIGINSNSFLLLSVGELVKNKNHKSVIDALAIIRNPAIHYIVAGQGVLKDEIARYADEKGLSSNVHLIGYRRDLPELYKSVDLFIHPSYREGMPVALMEAMASGCRVIASDVRGNRDLLDDALLFDPGDIGEIAGEIQNSYENQIAKATVDERCSLNNIMSRMKEIYEI